MLRFIITCLSSFTISIHGFAQIVVPANGCVTEDFDAAQVWSFGGANQSWTWGNPNKAEITDDITGGGNCLILGGNTPSSSYNNSEDSWAESPAYDLSAVNNPYIQFWFYHSNENHNLYDQIWMEYSTNGGVTWIDLEPNVGTNNCYDQNWYNQYSNWGGATTAANSFAGCSWGGGVGPNTWMLVRKCLVSLANEPSVMFRFRIDCGTTCSYYGATVDNFTVCDAHLDADASYTCASTSMLVNFEDLSRDCPDGWSWDFGDGNTSTSQNPTHQYTSPGTYTVSLTVTASLAVTAGCGGPFQDTHTFDIEVLDAATASAVSPSCAGYADGSASVNVFGSSGNETYAWTPTPGSGQGTSSVSGLGAGSYDVSIAPQNPGCPASITINITDPAGMSLVLSPDELACEGDLLNPSVAVSGGTPGYTYSWSCENAPCALTNDNSDTPSIVAGNSGYYYVLVNDASGCIAQDSVLVSVSPVPLADAGVDQTILISSSAQLGATPAGAISYTWTPATTLNDPSIEDPIASPLQTTTYYVVVSNGTCSDVDSVTINIIDSYDYTIPNIITPNGDGLNDFVFIQGLENFESNEMVIYNRWGQLVFQTMDYDNVMNTWNGTNEEGEALSDGVYFYTFRGLRFGEWVEQQGAISVVTQQ